LPHAAAFYGLEEVRAYDPMTFAPYERFLDAAGEKPRIGWHRILELDRPVLDFLGVRYVFDHPYHGERAGARKVYQGYDAVVYENPDALPRLFFPRAVEVVAGHEAALEVARSRQDYGSRVAISGPVMQESGPRSNPEARVVTLRFPAAGRVDAEVWTRGEAVLVSSQPAIPGWRARVDGEEAELLRAYGAFCALRVPAGRHRVELVYDPASWDVGRALAAIGGLLLLVAAGWPFRLSRPDRRPRARAEAGS
jgi:hypothetical protein